jgi:hypothetical protein
MIAIIRIFGKAWKWGVLGWTAFGLMDLDWEIFAFLGIVTNGNYGIWDLYILINYI